MADIKIAEKKPVDGFFLEPMQAVQGAAGNWYKNIGFIGKGGNGVTFLTLCTGGEHKGQIFALKGLYKISSPERIERFSKEVAFLKDNDHPCLLKHFDSGTFYERPFVIMTYIPNTLADEMKKGVSIGKGLIYTTQLLSAISCLHSKNVIHRDVKPQNIFINNSNAILGDFGLIKKLKKKGDPDDVSLLNEDIESRQKDFEGYVAMPQFYRTPELVNYANRTGDLHLASDIFQLGLVFAQMFSGWNPLKATPNLLDPVKLNPVRKIEGKFGSRIASTIRKMLDRNPDKRPSASSLLDHFTGIYADYASERLLLDGGVF